VKWIVLACAAGTIALALWHREGNPACELPERDCVEGCDELVRLPAVGPGYIDDFVLWEDSPELSTSYLRRDLMMLVTYAAAKVACEMEGNPIGLGDASDVDGNTPGTTYGRPRHPRTTHENGYDIDIAYYQRGTPNNRIRAVCATGEEMDAFRCVKKPHLLDARRTALFVGTLFESERVRIVGVDGSVAPPLVRQLERLCKEETFVSGTCGRIRLGFETERTGRNWYYGHHNHLHVSLKRLDGPPRHR
jgi:hypothetical protein